MAERTGFGPALASAITDLVVNFLPTSGTTGANATSAAKNKTER